LVMLVMDCTFGRASLKTKGRKTEGIKTRFIMEKKEQLSMEVVVLSKR